MLRSARAFCTPRERPRGEPEVMYDVVVLYVGACCGTECIALVFSGRG